MKPRPETLDLRAVPDLVGRTIDVYHEGRRCARVWRVVGRSTLTVSFQARPGRHRVPASSVLGVWFRKRCVPLEEWTRMRSSYAKTPRLNPATGV